MSSFLSVRALHEEGVPKKTIARRLGLDRRTVRRYIRCIERGASEPRRAAVSKKLDAFLEVIDRKSVQEGLGGSSAARRGRGPVRPPGSGRRGPGRPRNAGRRRACPSRRAKPGKRVRRSTADLDKIAARVLAQVRSKQGQRLEEIGKALKTDTAILKKPVANLLAGKKLRTTGAKRGTKYFAR